MKRIDIKGVIVSNDVKWIYDLFEIEATSPRMVYEQIKDANDDDLEVIINSGGGDVFAGSEIYTILKSYAGDVVTKIVGIAASVASVIAMAGKKVLISPTAQMMIHNVSAISQGDYRDMRHSADVLENYNKSIANAYMLKSGMSQEELLKLMDEETWFNAQQAKEKNLVDEIMFDDNSQPVLVASAGNAQMIPQQVINKIRNEFSPVDNKEEILKKVANVSIGKEEKVLPLNHIKKEESHPMNLEELKQKHPDVYNQVKNEGYNEGVQNERERIKKIEDMTMPGHDKLAAKAKFETGIKAEEFAMEMIKAEKQRSTQFLKDRNEDAQPLNEIEGSHAPDNNDSSEKEREQAIKAMARARKSEGGQ